MSKMIVHVTFLFSSGEKTNWLNEDAKSSTATGGKRKPKHDMKNEIDGGIECGRLAFFLKYFEDAKNIISAKPDIIM